MSEIIDLQSDEALELDEFYSYIAGNVRPGDQDSMLEHAWALRALANNRDFLLSAYHDELKAYFRGERSNEHQPQSLPLKSSGDFFVRANIWLPIEVGKRTEEFEKRLYAFELPHDHNFSFLTVGYFGPGYETDIYTYQHDACVGYLNEEVECDFQGRYRLSPGRIIHFKSGRDVHVQYVPDEICVSLNLLSRNPKSDWQQQYIFDVQNKRLIGGAGDVLSNRLFLVEVAGTLGNDETVGLLHDLVHSFPCAKTKAIAIQSLDKLAHIEAERARPEVTAEVLGLSGMPLITGNYARSFTGG